MLTFPPGILAENSVRVPVIFRGNGVVALSKPAGTPIERHPWNAGHTTLCDALRRRIEAGSAAARELGLARPSAVALTDAECSGAVLLADRDGNALAAWRNAFGSEQFVFRFVFLAKTSHESGKAPSGTEFSCALPVATHFAESRALISHKTGKKSLTRFVQLENFGAYALWRAETAFPRLHQIRLHAAECGLPIVGDPIYGNAAPIPNSAFCRKGRLNKGEARPIYAAACLHLEKILVPAGELLAEGAEISAPLPDGFAALLKKLRAGTARR